MATLKVKTEQIFDVWEGFKYVWAIWKPVEKNLLS